MIFGVFFIAAGVAFLLDRLDVWDIRARYVLPLVLIVLGVAILLGRRSSATGDGD
ncbi:MAG: LiaI-LiaF-like domain-containing protein [Actinomycetota bacterium]